MGVGPGEILFEVAASYLLPVLAEKMGRYAVRQAARGLVQLPDRSKANWSQSPGRSVPDGELVYRPRPEGEFAVTTVVSHTPGRTRLGVAGLRNQPDRARPIEWRLANVPGVREVKVNTLTGRVLLEYDPSRTTLAQIRATLEPRLPRDQRGPGRLAQRAPHRAAPGHQLPRLAVVND